MKLISRLKDLIFLSLCLLIFKHSAYSQVNEWIWQKGDSTNRVAGVYGTRGVASAANKPGTRRVSVSWTDKSNNLWLFGGNGYDANGELGYLNDLWKYNIATKEWTWMKGDSTADMGSVYGIQGVSAVTNKPGGRRRMVSWTDGAGDLWMFGGNDGDYLNDLWKYNIPSNEWTWVKGDSISSVPGLYGIKGVASPANKPGARYAAISWTDLSGSLWLFGGYGDIGAGQVKFNDLWKYNIAANQWTWLKGDSTGNNQGVYGIPGTSSSQSNPGARGYSMNWTDLAGNLWLFGGNGYDAKVPDPFGGNQYLNDLWKYTISTNQWTWVKGDSLSDVAGIYGNKGMPAPSNMPGARESGGRWTDATGNLWLFGGSGITAGGGGMLNDLWRYNIALNEWTWIKGDSVIDVPGVYGTQGISAPLNNPGAREYGVSWTDTSGNFWLFGGTGYYAPGESDYLNDLWEYKTTANCTVNTWLGTLNNKWNEPGNWSCGTIPGINTDVIINTGSVILDINTSIKSLKVNPGAVFTILPGFTLVVSQQ